MGQRQKYKALRDTLTDALYAPLRKARSLVSASATVKTEQPSIWALKDISFEIKQGEVVGVIGRNGAGKSTLLKILSRITEPTAGFVDLHGRVGSLLEVGTGFHPELTGRDNIYLNGSIIGMKKGEINRKFDEIVAFAEIEQFLDTPVKFYSSGMYMRLAFSVAAHLDPEILLVDEVLAVGDAAFQKKCLGKMGSVAEDGRTVIFVSHNMAAIRKLCRSALFLNNGHLLHQGPVMESVRLYLDEGAGELGLIMKRIQVLEPAICIESVRINGSPYDQLDLSEDTPLLEIEIVGTLSRRLRMDIEGRLFDTCETPLAFFSPGHERGYAKECPPGRFRLMRRIMLPRLMRGEYTFSLYITDPDKTGWVDLPHAVRLRVAGVPTATGRVFDCANGSGWILLSEVAGHPEAPPAARGIHGMNDR
jgi:lipopolysaccharide transport system ATP-binding protein